MTIDTSFATPSFFFLDLRFLVFDTPQWVRKYPQTRRCRPTIRKIETKEGGRTLGQEKIGWP